MKAQDFRKSSHLETLFALQIKDSNLPAPEREYRFHPGRQWRFDFAWPDRKLAVEIEGGTYQHTRTGHSTGNGIHRDLDKYNAATIAGWQVLRFDTKHVNNLEGIKFLVEVVC